MEFSKNVGLFIAHFTIFSNLFAEYLRVCTLLFPSLTERTTTAYNFYNFCIYVVSKHSCTRWRSERVIDLPLLEICDNRSKSGEKETKLSYCKCLSYVVRAFLVVSCGIA